MNRTLRYLLLLVLTGVSGSAIAQEILGMVTDKKKEPITNASVSVKQGGILKGGAITDLDGKYSVKPLEAGYYDVTVSYLGYQTTTITKVIVSPGEKTGLNFVLEQEGTEEGGKTTLKTVTIKSYKKPLVDPYKTNTVLTSEEIKTKPTTQTVDLVALTPGIYQSQRGAGINSDGGRSTANQYIIDGVVVQGSTGIDMAQGATEQLEVISSGIPANYGDVTGAVINITSKGVAQKFGGGVRLQHSIDGYNNNLASFSIAGPLLKRRIGTDTIKRPVMGFSLSGDYYDDHNRYPAYYAQPVAKASYLDSLRKNPLRIVADNSGVPVYNLASEYTRASDLTTTRRPSNNTTKELRLNGKIDYRVSDNARLAAGGMFDYTRDDLYGRSRGVFAPEATPVQNAYTGRGFIRFNQKFGKAFDTGKHGLISNASYTVQLDYQRLYQNTQDPRFKENIFEYAYVGKFDKKYQPFYFPNQLDSVSGYRGTVLLGQTPTGISYYRDERNANLANYTTQYYNSIGDNLPLYLFQMQAKNALANGDEPPYTYGMFYSPGASLTYYSNFTSNQYALTVDASFDLKAGGIKHGIEFGLYYQQRIQRSYAAYANRGGTGTQSLWQLMRQLVSSRDNGNLTLDKSNPIFRVNGKDYSLAQVQSGMVIPGPTDTIYYNYANRVPTPFDQNLRKRLNDMGMKVSNTDDINIDMLNPSVFSLNLFTADELLNAGNPYVNYYGYTYSGGAQTGTVNFNDYWTAKDANGNYTRPIGAFSPNYIAGYVLDKFEVKNILFNIGVRVERYSANTKVLKDPYSLYATKTISETPTFSHPSNLPGSAVVYVNDNSSTSPAVVGYRDGSNWYDNTGKFISDPAILKDYSGGRDPQPMLVDNKKITDSNFNPNSSFTDYNPQVTVMPRIQIRFPITELSNFFAHYDVYVQRPYPTSLGIATAYDYYYLNQNSNQIISNANLRSQKLIDYELGFEQAIGKTAALKIIGFYKERKDMITVQPYLYAWPTTYYTYGNRDFSSTKGVKLSYDMRATNHLTMNVSYTLQFAEGTGSDPYSTNSGGGGQISPQGLLQSFIEAGLPNLRYVSSLSYDSRHNVTASLDYRYGNDEGPTIAGKHVFSNSGINLIARTRSGEPYTRLANPVGNTIIGGINGSRLPWHFGMDARINKDFAFTFGRKSAEGVNTSLKPRKTQSMSVFVYVQNLLNTREILGVYGYTGRPDDDGFLTSSYGAAKIPQQINPASYVDMYTINMRGGNVNYARTINFGLEYNF